MKLVVIADDVHLRADPRTDALILDVLSAGTVVQATTEHGWRLVQTDEGTLGWVAVEYLREAP